MGVLGIEVFLRIAVLSVAAVFARELYLLYTLKDMPETK